MVLLDTYRGGPGIRKKKKSRFEILFCSAPTVRKPYRRHRTDTFSKGKKVPETFAGLCGVKPVGR